MLRRLVVALAALAVAAVPTLHAAGPQFWRLEGARTFLEGDIEGLSLDSDGRLRLGASPRPLFDPEAPNAWCVARDARGVLYVGTGNDGRVLRVDGTKGSVLFDAEELEVHAVAAGPDGRVYAATSPDGAVYAIDAAGKATRFFDPPETYVWALAFDPKGALYVATGGEGRVYRVSADGKSEPVLTSTETHILSLAVDARGRVYAGSAPEGLVYRIDGPGKVFVLLDSAFREIKALDVGEDGSLYAAAIDGRTTESPARATPAPSGSGAVVAEVTVTESYAVVPASGGAPVTVGPAGTDAAAAVPAKGALLRIRPSGEIDTLWSSPDDIPHSLLRSGPDVLVGTGNKGKVYRVGDDGRWALVATLPAEQVTALARDLLRGCRPRDREPGPGLLPRRGARRAGVLPLEGEGHRDGLELGAGFLGRHGAAGNGGPRPDQGGQHGDPGLDLDRLVGAFDSRAGRAHPQREGALPPTAPHPGRQGGGEPHGRGGGRGVPAAQPAARSSSRSPSTRPARPSRSRSP